MRIHSDFFLLKSLILKDLKLPTSLFSPFLIKMARCGIGLTQLDQIGTSSEWSRYWSASPWQMCHLNMMNGFWVPLAPSMSPMKKYSSKYIPSSSSSFSFLLLCFIFCSFWCTFEKSSIELVDHLLSDAVRRTFLLFLKGLFHFN